MQISTFSHRVLQVGMTLAVSLVVAAQIPGSLQPGLILAQPPQFLGPPGQLLRQLEGMSAAQFQTSSQSAATGDVASQALLCVAYRIGKPVAADQAQARSWCAKAAAGGNVAAMEELAMLDLRADSTAPDPTAGLQWLRKAADAGSPSAMDNLGTIYADGVFVPQDSAQAWNWYQKSAAAAFAPGELDLAIADLLGQGVKADKKKGYALIASAAQAGLPRADFMLGELSLTGKLGMRRSTAAALQYFQAGAGLGGVKSANSLGWMYANGIGVTRDEALAVKWYGVSAAQGDPVGEYGLGVRYLLGQGVARDPVHALQLFQAAATSGHADAAYNAALILLNIAPGHPGPPDYTGAAKDLNIAAAAGITDGQCLLGQLYAKGLGISADPVRADEWFTLSHAGTHECDPDRRAIETTMTAAQREAAHNLVAAFTPKSVGINYGGDAPHH